MLGMRMGASLLALSLAGCASLPDLLPRGEGPLPAAAPLAGAANVSEQWVIADPQARYHDIATWQSPTGPWLIAAAPDAGRLDLYDATGQLLQRLGDAAEGEGENSPRFVQPHRLYVIDDLLFVVERKAARVQVLQLPSFETLLSFGDGDDQPLIRPQGLWVQRMADWGYHVYIADQYGDDGTPQADTELRRRIKQYGVARSAIGWSARGIRAFGEISGRGRLVTVDTLAGDAASERLLIADTETQQERRLKVYGLNGRYLGRSAGSGVFRSAVQGVDLLACGEGPGYWVSADTGINGHYLHLFDRQHYEQVASLTLPSRPLASGVRVSQNTLHLVTVDGRILGYALDDLLRAGQLGNCPR